MTRTYASLDTAAVHAGEDRLLGAVNTPVFQSATFAYRGGEAYHDIRYARLNNTPGHDALHAKLAALEGGAAALVTASGMAAISGVLLALLDSGDHLLVQRGPYGGTHGLLTNDLARLGIAHDWIDADAPATWAAALKPRTRLIYVEAMTNPRLEVPDFEAVLAFARRHQLLSVIDNTLASPVNFRPLGLGFDLVLHSCTKYLNGHSDIVAGAVIGGGPLVTRVKHCLDHLGGCLDAHACNLLQRGIKTLAVRVRHQNASALAVARFLEDAPDVARVHYPGLASHPQHARAARLFAGGGGVVSFTLAGGAAAAARLIAGLTLPLHAPSLGGVESLVTCPATTTHAGLSAAEQAASGLDGGLVRLSVGLEASADLIQDLEAALAGM